jgi:DNA-directed RNA polymerase subunit M/transcription elongation factor TFIIS
MSQKFQKKKEDFVCGNCGAHVVGNGFTNHCPKCLYSKHVDVFPGDREAKCAGLMKLIKLESVNNTYILTHKCVTCGYEKRNKMSPDDDFDVALQSVKRSGEA